MTDSDDDEVVVDIMMKCSCRPLPSLVDIAGGNKLMVSVQQVQVQVQVQGKPS